MAASCSELAFAVIKLYRCIRKRLANCCPKVRMLHISGYQVPISYEAHTFITSSSAFEKIARSTTRAEISD